MNATLNPVNTPVSLEKIAYNAIKEAIITFKFKPNDSLVESELAKQLGISKTPVRDALMKLENEGFVTKKAYTGTYVSEITKKSIMDIFLIRASLEGLAVRLACLNVQDNSKSFLKNTIEQFKKCIHENKRGDAALYNRQFHQHIIQLSDNDWLVQILANCEDHLQRLRVLSNFQQGRLEKSIDEHEEILMHLLNRDVDQAEQAMKRHLLSALKDLEKQDIDQLVQQACQQ